MVQACVSKCIYEHIYIYISIWINIQTDKHTLYIYMSLYMQTYTYIHTSCRSLNRHIYIYIANIHFFPWGLLLSQSLTLPIAVNYELHGSKYIPITEVCCIDTMSTICDRIISTLQGFGNQIDAIPHAARCSCTSGSRTSNHQRNVETQIWRVSLQGIGAYRSPVCPICNAAGAQFERGYGAEFAPWGRLHVGMWVCGYRFIYIYI